ncbi:MAG TPA: multicopper oxidase family protein [Gaiellaceae bacterium]|nr:multicopper oxidase family protein [Gaiellaceae bacterium]
MTSEDERRFTRRELLLGGAGLALAAGLGGYGVSRLVAGAGPGEVVLRPRRETVELGRRRVATWTFGEGVPGRELRVRQGERLRVRVENALPEETTIHWHGVRVPNAMDGVPGMTQRPIAPGSSFVYEFAPPDAGTYWFHPHVGTQLDRGLYAPLVVEARDEQLAYDREATLVLDDWLDGLGRTPAQALRDLRLHGMQMPGMQGAGAMSGSKGMAGMDMGGLASLGGADLGALGDGSLVVSGDAVTVAGEDPPSGTLPALVNLLESGDADPGDVVYPLFLVNGRPPDDPFALEVSRGERLRLRLLNAAADTHFLFTVDGHPFTLVATDGQRVEPVEADGVVLGMGERADVLLDATRPGAYRLLARPLGKRGRAVAILRYREARRSAAPAPAAPAAAPVRVPSYADLKAVGPAPAGRPRELPLDLGMDARRRYRWLLGGQAFPQADPIALERGEHVRFLVRNRTTMPHPVHLHGHFFSLGPGGPLKDTVVVPPQAVVGLDVVADNAGAWMIHCHNLYHQLAGMMRTIEIA